MLGKLIKYEFKATGRTILPLCAAVLIVTIINKLIFTFNAQNFAYGIPSIITMATYIMLVAAMFVITLLVMVQRFYKNLLKDEGYLMFTLPVKANGHIFAKLIVSSVWTIVGLLVSFLSVFILAYSKEAMSELSNTLNMFFFTIDLLGLRGDVIFIIIEALFTFFIALFMGILMIYCAISIGQLFNSHKVAGSFAAYVGIYMVLQIANSIVTVIASLFINSWVITTPYQLVDFLKILLGGLGTLDLIWAVVFFFVSNYLLNKKLNLE